MKIILIYQLQIFIYLFIQLIYKLKECQLNFYSIFSKTPIIYISLHAKYHIFINN